jgi:hypothetical protein
MEFVQHFLPYGELILLDEHLLVVEESMSEPMELVLETVVDVEEMVVVEMAVAVVVEWVEGVE